MLCSTLKRIQKLVESEIEAGPELVDAAKKADPR
jgi:hypothetical protein